MNSIQAIRFQPPTTETSGAPLPGTNPAAQQVAARPSGAVPDTLAVPSGTHDARAGAAQIEEALESVRQVLAPVARNLLFSLDEESGETIIKVIDSSTDEVIRQIPSEEILAISKALDTLQGLLLQQQA